MAGGELLAVAAGLGAAAILREKRRLAEEWVSEHGPLPGAAAKPNARVCIYQAGVPEESTFAGQACAPLVTQGYERQAVRNRTALQRLLESYASFDRLVLAGHGDPSWYFAGWGSGTSVNPEMLARWLQGRILPTTVISLAGCRAGADPGTPQYSSVPGGASSFAGRLRDLLLAGGAPTGGEIRAHTTTGHTTENPYARVFRIAPAARGAAGVDVSVVRGAPAAQWILGLAGYGPGLGAIPIRWV
jgi:hypothetical protein